EGLTFSAHYQGKYLEKTAAGYLVQPLFAYRSIGMPSGQQITEILREKTRPTMVQQGRIPLSFFYRQANGTIEEKPFTVLEAERNPILLRLGHTA
ncbi:hypothetical protein ABTB94_20450, partial [Acinetobacter baumannii]